MRRTILNESHTIIQARLRICSEIKRLLYLLLLGIAICVGLIIYGRSLAIWGILIALALPNIVILARIYKWMWMVMGLNNYIRLLRTDVVTFNIRDNYGYIKEKVNEKGRITGIHGEKTGKYVDGNFIRDSYGNIIGTVDSDGDIRDSYGRVIGSITDRQVYHNQPSTGGFIGFIVTFLVFVLFASFILEFSPLILIVRLVRRGLDLKKYNKMLRSNDFITDSIRAYCEGADMPSYDPKMSCDPSAPWIGYISHEEDIRRMEARSI